MNPREMQRTPRKKIQVRTWFNGAIRETSEGGTVSEEAVIKEKVFKWCEKLGKHLSNHKWKTIPNEAVKRMLLACIMGSARQEIVLLLPTGLAFESYETGKFSWSC